MTLVLFIVAAVLAGVAAFLPKAGPVHLGWVAVGIMAVAFALGAEGL